MQECDNKIAIYFKIPYFRFKEEVFEELWLPLLNRTAANSNVMIELGAATIQERPQSKGSNY